MYELLAATARMQKGKLQDTDIHPPNPHCQPKLIVWPSLLANSLRLCCCVASNYTWSRLERAC